MNVQVNVGYPLTRITGASSLTVSVAGGASVADVLAQLSASFPGLEQQLRRGYGERHLPFNFFVNRRAVGRQELGTTPVSDGDLLHILLPVAGG